MRDGKISFQNFLVAAIATTTSYRSRLHRRRHGRPLKSFSLKYAPNILIIGSLAFPLKAGGSKTESKMEGSTLAIIEVAMPDSHSLPNIDNLQIPALEELQQRISIRIDELHDQAIAELREKFKKDAEAAGVSFDEIIGKRGGGRKRGTSTRAPATPKYRNPADAAEVWSGRGRQPKWVETQVQSGKKLEDLRIKKPGA